MATRDARITVMGHVLGASLVTLAAAVLGFFLFQATPILAQMGSGNDMCTGTPKCYFQGGQSKCEKDEGQEGVKGKPCEEKGSKGSFTGKCEDVGKCKTEKTDEGKPPELPKLPEPKEKPKEEPKDPCQTNPQGAECICKQNPQGKECLCKSDASKSWDAVEGKCSDEKGSSFLGKFFSGVQAVSSDALKSLNELVKGEPGPNPTASTEGGDKKNYDRSIGGRGAVVAVNLVNKDDSSGTATGKSNTSAGKTPVTSAVTGFGGSGGAFSSGQAESAGFLDTVIRQIGEVLSGLLKFL